MMKFILLFINFYILINISSCDIINITKLGAIAGDSSTSTCIKNTNIINKALLLAKEGDTILIPSLNNNNNNKDAFYIMGGINANNLHNITLQIDGILMSSTDIKNWPIMNNNHMHILQFTNCSYFNVIGKGLIDGQGLIWWDLDILGDLKHGRPKMIVINQSKYVKILHLNFKNSPSWHVVLGDLAHVEVGYITINVDRQQFRNSKLYLNSKRSEHNINGLEPEDLNTDGIDPSGTDFWIHDCVINNDDDSIAVKPCNKQCTYSDCSENMIIERMNMTGFGASIGSVPPSSNGNCVRNITFRDIMMPETGKGIYIKSNPLCQTGSYGIIDNIKYENITILQPRWWSIWIGPQQQQEPHTSLGRKCALDYPIDPHCPTQGCVSFSNIYLKDVYIHGPWLSPGVILGNATNPMINITFDNVFVQDPGIYPYNKQYQCENVKNSRAIGNTYPVPPCMSKL